MRPLAFVLAPMLAQLTAGAPSAAPSAASSSPPPSAVAASPPPVVHPLPPNVAITVDDGVRTKRVHIRGQAEQWGSQRFIARPGSDWTRLCVAPCNAVVVAGRYEVAVEESDGELREVGTIDVGDAPTALRIHTTSRATARWIGGAVVLGSVALGGYFLSRSSDHDCSNDRCKEDGGALQLRDAARGFFVLAGGLTAGLILMTRDDHPSVERTATSRPRVQPYVSAGGLGFVGSF